MTSSESVTLSNLAKCSMTRSVAASACDSISFSIHFAMIGVVSGADARVIATCYIEIISRFQQAHRLQPSDNGLRRGSFFSHFGPFSEFENWSSQWLSRGNLDLKNNNDWWCYFVVKSRIYMLSLLDFITSISIHYFYLDTRHWRVDWLRIHSAKGDVTRSSTMEKKDIGVVVCCRQPSSRKVD